MKIPKQTAKIPINGQVGVAMSRSLNSWNLMLWISQIQKMSFQVPNLSQSMATGTLLGGPTPLRRTASSPTYLQRSLTKPTQSRIRIQAPRILCEISGRRHGIPTKWERREEIF